MRQAIVAAIVWALVSSAAYAGCADALKNESGGANKIISCLKEIEKENEILKNQISLLKENSGGINIPSGAVIAFALETGCPTHSGWFPYEKAQGRFIVGAVTKEEILNLPARFAEHIIERQFDKPGGTSFITSTQLASSLRINTSGKQFKKERNDTFKPGLTINNNFFDGRVVVFTEKNEDEFGKTIDGNDYIDNSPPYHAVFYCIKGSDNE